MIGFISNVCICVTLMFQFDQLRLLQRYFCNDLDHEKINKGTSIFGTLDYLLVHWLTSKKKGKEKEKSTAMLWLADRFPWAICNQKKKRKKYWIYFVFFFVAFEWKRIENTVLFAVFYFPGFCSTTPSTKTDLRGPSISFLFSVFFLLIFFFAFLRVCVGFSDSFFFLLSSSRKWVA